MCAIRTKSVSESKKRTRGTAYTVRGTYLGWVSRGRALDGKHLVRVRKQHPTALRHGWGFHAPRLRSSPRAHSQTKNPPPPSLRLSSKREPPKLFGRLLAASLAPADRPTRHANTLSTTWASSWTLPSWATRAWRGFCSSSTSSPFLVGC